MKPYIVTYSALILSTCCLSACAPFYNLISDSKIISFLNTSNASSSKEFSGSSLLNVIDVEEIDDTVLNEKSAVAVAKKLARFDENNLNHDFEIGSSNAYNNHQYYRLKQTYKGIPVYGSGAALKVDSHGNVLMANESTRAIDSVDFENKCSKKKIELSIYKYYSVVKLDPLIDLYIAPFDDSSLLIYPIDNEEYRLVYRIEVAGKDFYDSVYVDAKTADIIKINSNISYSYDLPENGEIRSYSVMGQRERQSFDAYYFEPDYYMKDPGRKIELYRLGTEEYGWNWILEQSYEVNNDDISEVTWTQAADLNDYGSEVDAFSNLQKVFDALLKKGYVLSNGVVPANIIIYTNMAIAEGTGLRALLQGKGYNYNNAFSYGSKENNYGFIGVGANYSRETTSSADLDIMAHEFGHLIVNYEIGDMDSAEAKAINEGIADIIGELIEYEVTGRCNWIHGSQTPRNLINPTDSENQLDSYLGFTESTEEHAGSTILSHAAYLMWNGIDGDTRLYESLNEEDLYHLWFDIIRMMPENCGFNYLRDIAVCTAKSLHVEDPERFSWKKVCTVYEAFNQVDVNIYTVGDKISLNVYSAGKEEHYNDFRVSVINRANAKEKTYTNEDALNITFDEPGLYQIAVIDNKNKDNVTYLYFNSNEGEYSIPVFVFSKCGLSSESSQEITSYADMVNHAEFNGHTYALFDLDMDWHEAREYCNSVGGYLASITSKEEDLFVYDFISANGYKDVYFGLSDAAERDHWVWESGEDYVYSNWHAGEPNHQDGYEYYGMYFHMFNDGTWNDGDGGKCAFLCEWNTADADVSEETEGIETAGADYQDISGSSGSVSTDEAKRIAYEYWGFNEGDKDPETGFDLFINEPEMIEAATGRKYYVVSCFWFVSEGDRGHPSRLDTIYIDIESGEVLTSI